MHTVLCLPLSYGWIIENTDSWYAVFLHVRMEYIESQKTFRRHDYQRGKWFLRLKYKRRYNWQAVAASFETL